MTIHLDRILAAIAKEKVLHPCYTGGTKEEIDDAWIRVANINKISVHESRSIFKVLLRKYWQEKGKKEPSSWKLFGTVQRLHQKVEPNAANIRNIEQPVLPIEEEEEYEMLDVHEDEEAMQQGTLHSDDDSPSKLINSLTTSPENESNKSSSKIFNKAIRQSSPMDDKKVLNTLATPRTIVTTTPTTAATAAALQKKGITLKKTTATPAGASVTAATAAASSTSTSAISTSASPSSTTHSTRAAGVATNKVTPTRTYNAAQTTDICKPVQLSDSIKRKLSEDLSATTLVKKIHIGQTTASSTTMKTMPPQTTTNPTHTTTAQLMQVKQEREDELAAVADAGISLITIPANSTRIELTNGGPGVGGGTSSSTAATVASTSTNGFSPRIEDIDFKHDIIFDSGNSLNGNITNNDNLAKLTNQAGDIINFGNFDNSLPPTFFKNLCNSSRHEALGLYVANVMNRLRSRAAAKLELGILRAIIDVQSDELEQ